jgi:N-glycosylase/DNA lyase
MYLNIKKERITSYINMTKIKINSHISSYFTKRGKQMSEKLINDIRKLMDKEEIRKVVEERLVEFRRLRNEGSCEEIFSELSFCILTANYSAEGGIAIQKAVGNGFLYLQKNELTDILKRMGHRYPEKRAEFIVKNRPLLETICKMIRTGSGKKLREWLVENVHGIGMKEASHFLRNVGFSDVAIIDFHILNLLEKYGIIKKPKTLTKKKYLEIEEALEKIASEVGIGLDALDLYLWYMETGKVLK